MPTPALPMLFSGHLSSVILTPPLPKLSPTILHPQVVVVVVFPAAAVAVAVAAVGNSDFFPLRYNQKDAQVVFQKNHLYSLSPFCHFSPLLFSPQISHSTCPKTPSTSSPKHAHPHSHSCFLSAHHSLSPFSFL